MATEIDIDLFSSPGEFSTPSSIADLIYNDSIFQDLFSTQDIHSFDEVMSEYGFCFQTTVLLEKIYY